MLFEEVSRAIVLELNELSMGPHGHFATIEEFCGCPFACRDRQLSLSLGKGLSARSLHFSGSSDLSLSPSPGERIIKKNKTKKKEKPPIEILASLYHRQTPDGLFRNMYIHKLGSASQTAKRPERFYRKRTLFRCGCIMKFIEATKPLA